MTNGQLIWKNVKNKLGYIMPIKFEPSQVVKDRNTGKQTVKHSYMKSTATAELLKKYEGRNCQPKHRQKIHNELTKRKVDIPVLSQD